MKRLIFLSMVLSFVMMISGNCATDPAHEEHVRIVKEGREFSLGVAITNVKEEKLKELGLSGGAEIIEVLEDTEADRIGLKEGDIIIRFDGKKIEGARDIREMVGEIKEPKEVQIEIKRNGEDLTVKARLERADSPEDVVVKLDGDDFHFNFDEEKFARIPDMIHGPALAWNEKGGYLGVYAEELSDQLKEYFEVEHGVLVEKVAENSPAEKSGLKAGDVILEVEGRMVNDGRDLVRFINYYDPGDKVSVKYSRKGKVKSLEVELAEKKMHHKPFFKNHEKFMKKMKILPEKLRKMEEKLEDIKIDIEMYII